MNLIYLKIGTVLFTLGCAPVYKMPERKEGRVPEVKVLLGEVSDVRIKGKNLNTNGGQIKDGKLEFTGKECEIGSSDGIIEFNGNQYRGELIIYKISDSKFQVINKVNVEDYLRGVVPCELRTDEFDALKAQSVAARSFALAKLSNDKYDLTSTVEDQVYGGIESETRITDRAVKETRGVVCTYKGEIINAMYSSTCGGKTKDGGKPYLDSKSCQFCDDSPHYSWESEHPLAVFGRVSSIKVTKRDRSGRAELVEIISDAGNQTITGEELRRRLGLKSRFCDIRRSGDKIKITGKGYGHGIGLCQYGAVGMARKGYKYESILKYYYKGIRVERIY